MSDTVEDVEGTVLVRGRRVPATKVGSDIYRDVMCPHRGRYKLAQCGPSVAATFVAN